MNEQIIFDALLDWNPWGRFEEDLKEREVKPEIPEAEVALIIKGVRRCGKSRLSYMLSRKFNPEDVLIINFEDPRLSDARAQDIIRIIEIYQRKVHQKNPNLLILDEVQNVEGWEKSVRFFIENKKIKTIVTGSSSKLMSDEYATVLTGRHVDFELFPLSFREILLWSNIELNELEIYRNKTFVMSLLEDFAKFGGFPEIFKIHNRKEKLNLINQYFSDILMKDVVKRFRIRHIQKMENLAKIYIANISTLQSYSKLRRLLGISLDTVERFSRYLETSRLFLFVPKFSYSTKEQILNPKKVYCIDTAFYSATGFKVSENIGRIMENLVAIELFRRKAYWHNSQEIYYFKDAQQHEVDFVVKDSLQIKELIQVSYANYFDEVDHREIRALLKAKELLRCKNLTIITWDYEDEKGISWFGRHGWIKFVPLWRWLTKIE